MISPGESYHFVGIGGAGMSGLARLLLHWGVRVSGTDLRESATVRSLRDAGARVEIGHRAENLGEAGQVVFTAAAPADNPELVEARRRGLPVLSRAEMLARVMAGKRGIGISGTHGKTTSTAMLSSVLLAAGWDPSVLIGGEWSTIGGNARAGAGPHFVAEACEAFNSFLELSPQAALITNIEADHLDQFGSLDGVVAAFREFLGRLAPDGYAVGCGDDAQVRELLEAWGGRHTLYGVGPCNEFRAANCRLDQPAPEFDVMHGEDRLGRVVLSVPGAHNVLNALGVATTALREGVPFDAIERGLAGFSGVERRFQQVGEVAGVLVLDDYAHHPTEVAATLATARRSLSRRITVVFQPHLYSRTQLLRQEFARCFGDADRVLVTEIYAAREAPLPGVSGASLADGIAEQMTGRPVEFVGDLAALPDRLAAESRPGDLVMTMGAGDINTLGPKLVAALKEKRAGRAR